MLRFYYERLNIVNNKADVCISKAVEMLAQLYDIYASELRLEPPISQTPQSTTSFSSKQNKLASLFFKKSKQMSGYGSSSTSASQTYSILEDWFTTNHPIEDDIDILQWWRQHSEAYPVLSAIARDVFAIPASTIASESCFSAGRRLISYKRTRLSSKTVKRLICRGDWARAERRTQEQYERLKIKLGDKPWDSDASTSATSNAEDDEPLDPEEDSDDQHYVHYQPYDPENSSSSPTEDQQADAEEAEEDIEERYRYYGP